MADSFKKKRISFKALYANRRVNLALKIAGAFLLLVVIAWLCVAAYVNSNKKQLLGAITAQLNENLNGTLYIESMEPALIRGFPGISISLKNVLLRDSLWSRHHHDVLRAKEVYISVNAFSILSGSPVIKDISLNNGHIYLYTDSTGYRNTDLFKKDGSEGSGAGRRKKIKRIQLDNVSLVIKNEIKHSLFDFSIRNSDGRISYNSKGWAAEVNIRTLVNCLAFKTQKGSFLKNKELVTSLKVKYDETSDLLTVPMQNVQIDGSRLNLGGKFSFAETSSNFNLEVKAADITFGKVVSLLPQNISVKLKPYNLKRSFSAQASISGKLKKGGNPSIKVFCQTTNNTLTVKGENIENCTFNSVYNNGIVRGKGFTDQNSAIAFYRLKGSWSGIPFKADSVKVSNLKSPVIGGRFTANFPLTQLNSALGTESFIFTNGAADVNLWYQAPYNNEDQSNRYLYGIIQITDASATYLPRNLPFKNVQARLNFRGRDLFLEHVQVQSNSSILKMEGSVKDFSNLYYTDPQKLLLDWNISSPQVNLGEFMSFLGKRKNVAGNSTTGSLSRQLNKMLEQGNIHMKVKVDRLLYKKFTAQNVSSDITLRQAGITIRDVSLSHAGGSLHINGNIDQNSSLNEVKLNTRIVNANVQQLFKAFNNFGQSTITDQNLKGSFNAVTNVSALMREDGEIVPWSVNGTVNFNLRNGALVNFDPMLKLGAFAFPNRNFSNITLKDLKNTLVIQGKTVSIPPMHIESSVLNVFMQGVYGFSSGTDISLQIPLRNPKKDEFIFDKEEKEKRSTRGIVLNMHAVDGADGKVKFKLGK